MLLFTRRGLALAGCFAAVSLAHAAANSDPAQPNAAVPATQYQSAFQDYAPAKDASVSPGKEWRAANAAVAADPGHGDMPGMNMGGMSMGGMNMDGAMKMPMPDSNGKSAEKRGPKTMGKPAPMPKGMKMPMKKHPGMKMDMQMDMPMPMDSKGAAPPMEMHHNHGQEK